MEEKEMNLIDFVMDDLAEDYETEEENDNQWDYDFENQDRSWAGVDEYIEEQWIEEIDQ